MEIEFVCAGCGGECLICDLETEVTLTHCTECANKRISELEAQNKRLISRGFEDLHYENEQLKAKLERVQCAADELAEALADD